jgi:hypothetical protein
VVTPDEFRAYIRVAKEEGVGAFEIGDLKVSMAKAAFVTPRPAAPSRATTIESALAKTLTEDPVTKGEDPDLFLSVE